MSRSLALGLHSQHQTQFLSLPPDSIKKLGKSYDPRVLQICKYFHGQEIHIFQALALKPRLLLDAFALERNPHSTEGWEQQCPSRAEAVHSDVTSVCHPPSSAAPGLNKIHRHRMTELQVICHLAIFTTYITGSCPFWVPFKRPWQTFSSHTQVTFLIGAKSIIIQIFIKDFPSIFYITCPICRKKFKNCSLNSVF